MRNLMNKKWIRRVLLVLCIAAVAACVGVLCLDAYIRSSVKDRIITAEEAQDYGVDCILVLGAGVWENDTPSHMLADRLDTAIELYENGASDRLLMSGDHGQSDYDEVNVMKDYAIAAGVPSECIFMDHAGFSTYESLYRARDIFKADSVLIVTQKYHLYRALYVAEALGLEARGVPADLREYYGQAYRELREILARCKDWVYTIIRPEPTYLGEAIPVSGNGDATNDRAKEY